MTNELEYHQQLLPLSRAELVDKLRHALKKKRFDHVLRVEETAIELAQENGVDLELASIAALCHDYAKQRPDQDFIATVSYTHLTLPTILRV